MYGFPSRSMLIKWRRVLRQGRERYFLSRQLRLPGV